jgi:Protein of unknown function, DUF488
MNMPLETIGYTEKDAEARIAAFLAKPRSGLIDIRKVPWCGWSACWRKRELLAAYGSKQYIHLPGFGNVNYNQPGQPIQLQNPEKHLAVVVKALQRGASLMLLCGCKDYAQCHRKTVYELIMTELQNST